MKSHSNSSVQANEDEELTQALEAVTEVANGAIAVVTEVATEVIAVDTAVTEVTVVDVAVAEASEAAETVAARENTSQWTESASSATPSAVISQETAR